MCADVTWCRHCALKDITISLKFTRSLWSLTGSKHTLATWSSTKSEASTCWQQFFGKISSRDLSSAHEKLVGSQMFVFPPTPWELSLWKQYLKIRVVGLAWQHHLVEDLSVLGRATLFSTENNPATSPLSMFIYTSEWLLNTRKWLLVFIIGKRINKSNKTTNRQTNN